MVQMRLRGDERTEGGSTDTLPQHRKKSASVCPKKLLLKSFMGSWSLKSRLFCVCTHSCCQAVSSGDFSANGISAAYIELARNRIVWLLQGIEVRAITRCMTHNCTCLASQGPLRVPLLDLTRSNTPPCLRHGSCMSRATPSPQAIAEASSWTSRSTVCHGCAPK